MNGNVNENNWICESHLVGLDILEKFSTTSPRKKKRQLIMEKNKKFFFFFFTHTVGNWIYVKYSTQVHMAKDAQAFGYNTAICLLPNGYFPLGSL